MIYCLMNEAEVLLILAEIRLPTKVIFCHINSIYTARKRDRQIARIRQKKTFTVNYEMDEKWNLI